MRDEILINITPQETRVAIVENGLLQELEQKDLYQGGQATETERIC